MTEVDTQEPSSPAQSDPVANDDTSSQSPGDDSNIGDVKVGDTAQGKKVLAIRVTGTVKWFNVKNGYGFISRNDKDGEDVFVHQSAIKRNNPSKAVRSVGDGEVVEFDIVEGEKGNEAANVTGPGGTNVKGSPFAAERGRFYTGRSRGGFRGRFRPRGPPREGGVPYGAVAEGGPMVTSPRGGFRGGRGRPYMARRRFYGQPGRPVGQPGGQPVDGQQQVVQADQAGNGYQQQQQDNYEQRQPRGRPRRYIQRFFRRRPRGRRGEGESGEEGAEGEVGEQDQAGTQQEGNGGEEVQEGAVDEQGGARPRGRGRYYNRGRGGFRGRRPFRGRRGEQQGFEGEQGGDGAQADVPNGGGGGGGGASGGPPAGEAPADQQ